MHEILSIAPIFNEPGLVAYECPRCGYVASELTQGAAAFERGRLTRVNAFA